MTDLPRTRAEIARITALLLAGHPDIEGLVRALVDWRANERELVRELANCSGCGAPYSTEWAGTTCSCCDGDIQNSKPKSKRRVELGVVEFHSDLLNPGLRQRFFDVVADLRSAGCIVDLWLLDISRVLAEFGYEMEVYSTAEPEKSKLMSQISRNRGRDGRW